MVNNKKTREFYYYKGGTIMSTIISYLSIISLCIGISTNAPAQDTAFVNWELTSNRDISAASGKIAGHAVTGNNMYVRDYNGTLTNGLEGPLGKYQRWWINGNWPDESSSNGTRYIQFTVKPDTGFDFNVTSISLYINAGGTGNMKANFYYATKPDFSDMTILESNMSLSIDVATLTEFSINANVSEDGVFSFRIYPWLPGGSTDTGKYIYLQNMTISGTTSVSAKSATATWPLDASSATAVITSGGIKANEQTVSSLYIIRDYGGTEGSQRVYASGSGLGYWPDETSVNFDRYAQFTVSPNPGLSLNVDSISLFVGNSGGSNDVKAAIYYSTDNFAGSTQLGGMIDVPNSALTQLNYKTDITVEKGQTFALRVYPWLQGGRASGKYFNIKNVVISGKTTGSAIIFPPTVSTTPVSSISTTTAKSGGNISADGGAEVTERGVCWNTTGRATVEDSKTSDGTGTGSFVSTLTGLDLGTRYFFRAYATNEAGTSYGEESSFITLTELSTPTVTTRNVSEILTTSATSGGNVTFDGGLEVVSRGVCWNTTGNPTIADNKTENGSGLGSFTSYLGGLTQETRYFVRAYAINKLGVGYGEELSFSTLKPEPPMDIVVSQDGSGNYTTVQEAFDAVPEYYTGPITIFVGSGTYKEKLLLSQNKINVTLVGQDRDTTILTYDDYSGRKLDDGTVLGTSTSYSVAIDAGDFKAENITFQNTSQAAQAVALRVNGDRVTFINCRMLGYQDTYYTQGYGRIYNKDCYIEGTVDFIFGRSIAVFDNCVINSKRNSTITAASTEQNYRFGYVFKDCRFTADSGISRVQLGRPWRPYARTVVIHSELGAHIDPAGWSEWSGNNNHLTAYYAEYDCFGPGYVPERRVSWSHQLTDDQAADYTIENIFSKNSVEPSYSVDWLPPDSTE
jgi:pectin methylesterase-like acyl-CoA thioesterase